MIKPETSGKLIIALEPECAFIGAMRAYRYDPEIYCPNKKFLIVDCGGGTIDITGHEILSVDPLTVREIIRPDGDHFGSNIINDEILNFIKDFLGEERYTEISHLQEFVELEKTIEEAKVSFAFDPTSNELTRINLATVLYKYGKDLMGQLIESWNDNHPDSQIATCGKQAIGLSHDLMMSFFQDLIESIIQKVAQVINDNQDELSNLNYIIMAGGFCKNIHLNKRMNEEFHDEKNIKILLCKEADLLIVRGAAIFGCDPSSIIKIRKAKYTFGISYAAIFDITNEIHMKFQNYRFISSDGNVRIRAFKIHGKIGDDIEVDRTTTKSFLAPVSPDQTSVCVEIFVSDKLDPVCVYEEGVRKLATANNIELDMSEPFQNRGVIVKFSFGFTEVICCVYSLTGQFLRRISLDFSQIFV